MTVYATDADLRAYAVGLTLPADVSGALVQGNHWVTRQVERAGLPLTGSALQSARFAASAWALGVLAGNGLVTVGEQALEALELGPIKLKFGKASSPSSSLPDFQAAARALLGDAGLDLALEDQPEIVTAPRRRW